MLSAKRAIFGLALLSALFLACSDKCAVTEPEQSALTISGCPDNIASVPGGYTWSHGFTVEQSGIPDLNWSVSTLDATPVGTFQIDSSGLFSFASAWDDINGIYRFKITASTAEGRSDDCICSVEVLEADPFRIEIGTAFSWQTGLTVKLPIRLSAGYEPMAGFDFSIGYSSDAMKLISVEPGSLIGAQGASWEYFSYRFGAAGDCSGPCPSGWISITGIADLSSVPGDPVVSPSGGTLAEMTFLPDNLYYECSFLPVRFLWRDANDNSISSLSGDTLFVAAEVRDFEPGILLPSYCDSGWGFSFSGPCTDEIPPAYTATVPLIYYQNGGIDMVCTDPEVYPGDINHNGIPHEIADFVLYSEYFLQGASVLDWDTDSLNWATDINYDGAGLTIADLRYLGDIIAGTALPYPKLHPYRDTLSVTWQDGLLSIDSHVNVGAIWVTFAAGPGYQITNYTQMQIDTGGWFANEASVLVYTGDNDFAMVLPNGHTEVLSITGVDRLMYIQASDDGGNMMNVRVNGALLKRSQMFREAPATTSHDGNR